MPAVFLWSQIICTARLRNCWFKIVSALSIQHRKDSAASKSCWFQMYHKHTWCPPIQHPEGVGSGCYISRNKRKKIMGREMWGNIEKCLYIPHYRVPKWEPATEKSQETNHWQLFWQWYMYSSGISYCQKSRYRIEKWLAGISLR